MGIGHHVDKQIARVDEVAFGFDRIIDDFIGDDVIAELGVVDAVVATFNVVGEVSLIKR